MFCYQCEMAHNSIACTAVGMCGKDPITSDMQDVLIGVLKGIGFYAHRARKLGIKNQDIDYFVIQALFTTLTNVNFDQESLERWIETALDYKEKAKNLYLNACKEAGVSPEKPNYYAELEFDTYEQVIEQVTIDHYRAMLGEDKAGLREMLIYGLKGIAAYAYHAKVLGFENDKIFSFVHELLNFSSKKDSDIDELLQMALRLGEVNLWTMELLDKANTTVYGHPEPTKVRISPVKGKAILVSGHDLKDLEEILKQTQGTGINVYTHGELLPAHAYPRLKKYPHLVGNYGGAWQNQIREFENFPGAIVMTTNCIQIPTRNYKNRIFTTGPVDVPGVTHIYNNNFSKVIDTALQLKGFDTTQKEEFITIGFGHNSVLSVADKIIQEVKSGNIKHFFLVGGCDGPEKEREYYTKFVEHAPNNTVILTLGCGKFRFNTMKLGKIGEIPRLLDLGQCNDAFSAIKITQMLANGLETNIKSLPISLIVSWVEQKAVSILLTLLYLGIQGIKLGPRLPAFITPNVLEILINKFNISLITTPEDDLKQSLGY